MFHVLSWQYIVLLIDDNQNFADGDRNWEFGKNCGAKSKRKTYEDFALYKEMRQYYIVEDDDGDNFLCFCEYFNLKNQRSHLLGCCCDCEDVDEYVERKITGRSMPNNIALNIYRVLQDRCRIPWRGGARSVPLDFVLPGLILPALASIASINVWCTFIVFLALPFLVCHLMRFFALHFPKTKIFLFFSIFSSIYLLLIFENLVVPHLEILPSENGIFIGLVCFGCLFLISAKVTHLKSVDEICCADDNSDQNSKTKAKCPQGSMHCGICDSYVSGGEYHCLWLDCCIGEKNLTKYLTGVLLMMSALFVYSYLVLTTACHPFLLFDVFLVPDDCSDVFYDFDIALCFVGGTFSFLVANIFLILLLRHFYLALLGYTSYEWSLVPSHEKRCCRSISSRNRLHREHLEV